jgi:phosphodiesterase/alkaline phosphatase D-like protein
LDISTDNFTTFITGFNNRNTGINSLFTVVGLTANTSYQYRVRASINNIPSSNSNVISVTTLPNPPLATTVTAATNISDTGFTANWNPAATATEYFLDVAVNSSFTNFVGGFQNLNVSNVLTYDVTGLSPNTNYFFRVRAGNPGGVSGNSNFLAAFTTTEAPIALDADPISQTGFTANWQTTTGAINYRLDVSTDDLFGTFVAGYQNKSVSTTNDIISGLTPNFTYFYRVRAENSGGVSANSNVITVTTIPSAPSTPTAQAATGITQSGFTGNWSASPSAIGYRLDVSEASDFSSFVSSYQNADVGNVLSIAITGLNGGTTYYYRVRAENIGGSSANSNEINLITIPPTPVAIAATNVNQVSFEANWQASTGTTEYRLDVSQDNLFGSFLPGYQNKLVSGLTDLVSGLSNNTTYYYRVRAVNTTGTTPNSNTVSVTTQPPVPPAPTALPVLLASITETGFKARWNIVLTATQGYRIDVSEASDFSTFVSGYQDFDAGNNLEADVTGLLGSTTYYFRVRAVNNSGPSLNSNVVSVLTKPAAPLALPASNIVVNGNASGFTANWNADATATQYFLDVATSSAFGVGDFVVGYNNLNVGDVTSYDVTSLNDNTLYYYRLRTVNASGQSAGSNFIEVFIEDSNANIPPLPSGLSAFALSPTKIEVSWTDNSTNDTGFELQRTTNVLLGFTTIAIISVNNNNTPREEIYTDSDGGGGLIPGETYFYRVRALGALGNSQYTLPVRATTISDAPERPDNLDGVSGSATSAYLTWSDNSDDEQGFYLYRALDGNDVALVATIPANQTNYTDIGLTQGTTYFYVLTAFKGSSESETSNLAFVTPAPVPFPASSLTATATGVRSVNLTWQDNSTDETGFAIEMASVYSGGTFLFLTEVGAQEGIGTVNFNIDNTIETLESNEVYAFRVFAFNNFGGSRTTLPDTAQTFIDPTIPRPAKPTGVQAEPVSTIEIRLRWQDVSNNEKVFKIERADSPAGPFVEIARVLAGTTNYSDVGLRAGQTYYYRIIAANGGGNSNPSDVAFAQAVCNVIMVVTTDREANGSIVCDTKEIFLELNTNVTQANVVQWFKNDVAIEDANLNTYIASETGEYYCRIIAGDCDKSSSIISVIINPSFSVAAILDTTDRQNPQVEADIQGANSYQWYYNYEPIPGANADSYPVTQAGVYYVIITDEGCSATSNLVFVTESLITAVEEYDFSHLIRLAPNPAQESTQFKLETPVMGDYQIDLIDFTGKRHSVAAGKKETYLLQNTLNLAKYPAGLYLLEVRCRNYIGRKKMVHY